MSDPASAPDGRLARVAPGLAALLRYRRADLAGDLAGGLAVATVAVPQGIANAQLAGLPPAIGLAVSVLPLFAFAIFSTSRQMIVGPNASGAAIVAAAVAPLAGGDAGLYLSLAMTLTFLAGAMCVGASFAKLGAIADFLSKPILVGFLNGVAASVVLSQIGVLSGIALEASGIVPRATEYLSRLGEAHGPTLAVGLGTIALLVLAPRVFPKLPAALLAIVAAGIAVALLGLEARGVTTIGAIDGGLPLPRLPTFPPDKLPILAAEAAGLALVMFSTTMLATRAFAARHRQDVDADREIAALGAANLAAAMAPGFVVSGTNARTAVGEAAGGRTQMTGIVSAIAVAAVLAFLTGPLEHVPVVALAAILVVAGVSLVDFRELAVIRRIDPREFWLANVVTVGVVAFGPMNAILLAVALAILKFVKVTSRPRVDTLGEVPGEPGLRALSRYPDAAPIPGLALFRFNGPVVFFSAPYFRREVERVADEAGPDLRWFVLDLAPVTTIDATGLFTIRDVFDLLIARGVEPVMAARKTEWTQWARERGFDDQLGRARFYANLDEAVAAFRAEGSRAMNPADAGAGS
jgi:high affinity sulfate transporter 1